MTIMDGAVYVLWRALAIFAVFAAAFFGQNGALAVFSLYVLGIVMAVLTA
ncbi:ferrous iron transport protein B [Salmonella enterica subsp. enterica]|uniref:Ferrous iron transport protein B n=1 Tax=Salmonella enterica I TaxID=59201 RepID=A0A379WJW9_SALET|nr:ferrous iron transport protein B [Salmonella enterica subsp. enterica]